MANHLVILEYLTIYRVLLQRLSRWLALGFLNHQQYDTLVFAKLFAPRHVIEIPVVDDSPKPTAIPVSEFPHV